MIPFALTGASLFVAYKALPTLFNKYYPAELDIIKSYIESSLQGVYSTIKSYSIICLIILIILIVAQIIVSIYYHKKEDKEFSEL